MKKWATPASLTALVLLLATALSFAGCASYRQQQRAKMTASLLTVQGDLDFAQMQTQQTQDAMNELAVSPETDLRQAYEAFSESVGKMAGIGARLARHADGMRYLGDSYLVEPERSAAECQYPRLSSMGRTRPMELGQAFDPISERSWQVKRAFRAFDFDISQIRDQLSDHLTPEGVEALTFLIRKAQVDGQSLEYALEHALAAVQEAKTAQGEATPEGAETKQEVQ